MVEIVWLVEDSPLIQKVFANQWLQSVLRETCILLFSHSYCTAIEQLDLLSSDVNLYVALDCDLGSTAAGGDGVQLFFLIKEKFPNAYVVNNSSDPADFSSKLQKEAKNRNPLFLETRFDAVRPNLVGTDKGKKDPVFAFNTIATAIESRSHHNHCEVCLVPEIALPSDVSSEENNRNEVEKGGSQQNICLSFASIFSRSSSKETLDLMNAQRRG